VCAVAAAQAQGQPTAADALVRTRCLTCHGDDLIRQQRLSREGWEREIDKMIAWGAAVSPAEKSLLADALTRQPAAGAGDALLKARCFACHDDRLIRQQRLSRDGWLRELDKMIGWGATLTPAERDQLAAALARF
jgi:mono/diheme cytochrome c family protein